MNKNTKMMLMSEYGFKYSEIARALNVSRAAVHKWMTIDNCFPISRAKQIEELTNKRIKIEDLTK